jgi:hypothetical protein
MSIPGELSEVKIRLEQSRAVLVGDPGIYSVIQTN